MEESWTILELAELAAEVLAATEPAGPPAGAGLPASAGSTVAAGSSSGPTRANGRVREVPNERLVRWYVTVGLVDPPLSRRGRVARYGRRHLLQLVAVKRRQAEGRSLAEIQAELAGATDEALAAVACVHDTRPAPESPAPAAPSRFWARPPARRVLAAAERAEEQDLATERLVHGIRLAAGVTLLLEGADHGPGPDDLTAIVNAARPLLAELASRGLRADHLEWG
jgi:DNA-binding transcriptional MerR regulator